MVVRPFRSMIVAGHQTLSGRHSVQTKNNLGVRGVFRKCFLLVAFLEVTTAALDEAAAGWVPSDRVRNSSEIQHHDWNGCAGRDSWGADRAYNQAISLGEWGQ